MMEFYSVEDICTRCGLCSEVCPARIIDLDEQRRPFIAPEKASFCIRCGQCVAFCPVSCNRLGFQDDEPLPAVEAELMPSAESAETLLRSRRSIRRFKKKGLSRKQLERLLETVRYAPTAQNRQELRWVVVEKKEETDRIERVVVDFFRAAAEAPGTNPAEAKRLRGIVRRSDAGIPIVLRGAPQLAVAVVPGGSAYGISDGAIALTYLELAAHALGAGCCWAGFLTSACKASPEVKKSLGVWEDEVVAGAQMLGYPDQGRSRRLPPRKPLDVTWR